MRKLGNLLLFISDVILTLVSYPIFYVVDMLLLLYGNIRYDLELKSTFIGINKKYFNYIMNGLKIHKERILGV